eukprot:9504901-Ditylum_brightwellii.AAC.1
MSKCSRLPNTTRRGRNRTRIQWWQCRTGFLGRSNHSHARTSTKKVQQTKASNTKNFRKYLTG